ncbi:hypothetical protein [Undibacterium pigrum]|uniref:Response regulator receiver domain-containing protein n=1 Tax=Undibacterium pigrum TaxID=401470 RepID=A0A318JBU6_9BURK|nr:hypothetical protein [Undibacterium pigrum]PXX45066.1 response regulator receiver domain-containing protein [Undibacterium pigrum]
MPDKQRPGILLVDDDHYLQQALQRLLEPLQHPVVSASNADEANAIMATQRIAVLICEPRNEQLAAFLIAVREEYPDAVRLIITGEPDLNIVSNVFNAVNQSQPYKLLTKPWLNEDLLTTVRQALEQYTLKLERERLLKEYNGILNNAEGAHAFRTLDALMHSIHKDIATDAIQHLPMGACLLVDGVVSLCNASANRFLRELDQTPLTSGISVEDLPAALKPAYGARRKQRMQLRLNGQQRLDYFVLDLSIGTLIAFAPEPRLGRPPDQA